MHEAEFTVVDVETTGLSPEQGDRICEIALVRFTRTRAYVDGLDTLINPGRPVSPGASRVNRLTDTQLRAAPRFAQIAGEVRRLIDGAILVAQNAAFDYGFLRTECPGLSPRGVVDTIALVKALAPGLPAYNLDALAKHFDLPVAERHQALADAKLAQAVFLRVLEGLDRAGVVRTVDDLLKVGAPRL